MKSHVDTKSVASISSKANGYVVCNSLFDAIGSDEWVCKTFEEAVNIMARALGLVEIGERVVLSATKEHQESGSAPERGVLNG